MVMPLRSNQRIMGTAACSSGRLTDASPMFPRTVPQFFQVSRSPRRLNLLAERFGRFHHDIPEHRSRRESRDHQAPRRGWSTSLDGLRFHQPLLQRPTLLLLASGRVSQGHQDGSVDKTFADASGIEKCPSRMAGSELVCHRNRFCVSVGAQQGKETARPGRGARPNDQASVRQAWNSGRWLAYVPAFGREHVGRHGRAPAHHSRLLASQQPQRHQPILAGNIEYQASGSGQAGRHDPTERTAVCKQIPPDSVNSPGQMLCAGRHRSADESCLGVGALIGPKWTLIFRRGFGQLIEKYGRHEETRTPDLYRVKACLTATY